MKIIVCILYFVSSFIYLFVCVCVLCRYAHVTVCHNKRMVVKIHSASSSCYVGSRAQTPGIRSQLFSQIFLERISFILTWLTTVLIKYNLNNLQRFILVQCWEFRSLFSCPYYLGRNTIMQGKQLVASLCTRSTDKDWKPTDSLKAIPLKKQTFQ